MVSRVNAKEKDHVLAADYAYFILLMKLLRQSELQYQSSKEILDSPNTALGPFLENREASLKEFQQKLKEFQVKQENKRPGLQGPKKQQEKKDSKNDFHVISIETFERLVANYEGNSAKEFAQYVKDFESTEDSRSKYLGFLQHLFACLFHFNEKHWKQYVSVEVHNKAVEYFDKVVEYFNKETGTVKTIKAIYEDIGTKTEIIEANETCQIVNDLMLKDDASSLDGKMKIVRTSTVDDANTLYTSLVLARHVASNENYTFEVIRDFGNFKLDNLYQKHDSEIVKSDMITRVHQVLQTKKCQHREKDTYNPCDCETYSASLPSLICSKCQHEHTEIRTYKNLNKLPCIVIVILRGRVGDTFPPSFNCMDLRILDSIVEENPDNSEVSLFCVLLCSVLLC